TTAATGAFLLVLAAACAPAPEAGAEPMAQTAPGAEFGIVIHGGAGTIRREDLSEEREAAYHAALERALRAGYAVLEGGHPSRGPERGAGGRLPRGARAGAPGGVRRARGRRFGGGRRPGRGGRHGGRLALQR